MENITWYVCVCVHVPIYALNRAYIAVDMWDLNNKQTEKTPNNNKDVVSKENA